MDIFVVGTSGTSDLCETRLNHVISLKGEVPGRELTYGRSTTKNIIKGPNKHKYIVYCQLDMYLPAR